MIKDFNGSYIWIIGASSGIGLALAQNLEKKGANLILSARRGELLEENIKTFQNPEKHQILPLDIGDTKAVMEAGAQLKKQLPKLDSVIFLAAIYSAHSDKPKDIDFVHNMIHVNLGGAFNTVYAVRDTFLEQGFGQIALCASVAGYRGLPYGQPYCATKAGIINYAESLKIELEDNNIDVKVINPGFVETPLTNKNDFPMPMIIPAQKAAEALAKGLQSRRFEINFPIFFTFIMKTLRALPKPLYFAVSRLMKKQQ